ncbi:MAG: TlpA family protein disulfide reductase [Gammaproteobacteria bacterium]|nr:TlpA family protein disulfide reductase [Gammaproteobacteria bacterium]
MDNKIIFVAGLLALVVGITAASFSSGSLDSYLGKQVRPDASLMTGSLLPDFQLPDMDGNIQSSTNWKGKVLLVNFWATWCPPCRKEIPAFLDVMSTHGDRGFQVVGIAIDEKNSVQDYIDSMGIEYPVLIGKNDAIEISKQLGNRLGALPYTLITDRTGKVILTHRGELTKEDLLKTISPLF